jgi:hypothetical protein
MSSTPAVEHAAQNARHLSLHHSETFSSGDAMILSHQLLLKELIFHNAYSANYHRCTGIAAGRQ